MSSNLYQEFYKLYHRKVAWIAPFMMIFFMIIMGIAMGKSSERLLVMTAYNSSQWISLVLIIVGSTFFSMEFQNNAILTLLYKASSKWHVYLSKFIVIFIYDVILHLIAIIFTIILSLTPLNNPASWSNIYQYQKPLALNMIMNTGVDMITSLLIISLIFLLSCIINSNSAVITINILIIFMGPFVTTNLFWSKSNAMNILKWNPLNMTNLTQQYYNYSSYHPVTLLSNMQLLTGTILYMLLFTAFGYLIFRRKRF
ncbi:ABC transporter permease [Companilactobacillus keshanensis]|uniref:ABC transporter permease n=1 Tax=Companilactobacillus keshanensis TaxID=2486003 RepID=A0ABW4BT49_9LACO|nr:ABC transporter permease [Companilactobacillus keshanensis]